MAVVAWAWRRARTGLHARLRPEVPVEAPRMLPAPERPADARTAKPSPHKAA